MKMGRMDGVGYYTPPPKSDGTLSERKEALMRNNLLCCYHSGKLINIWLFFRFFRSPSLSIIDLEDGLEVEIQDSSLFTGSTNHPHVTIIHHKKGWIYYCRFHDEERPRERNVSVFTFSTND